MWSSELANPYHLRYWEGLLDQLILCRAPLSDDRIVLCPAVFMRTVGRKSDIEDSYTLDFSSSLTYTDDVFVRTGEAASHGAAPEVLARVEVLKPNRPTIAVPLIGINLPILKGIPLSAIRKVFDNEPSALQRLRVVWSELDSLSDDSLLNSRDLTEVAERLDYEVAQVQIEYDRLLRGRERILAAAGLGTVGLVLSVSLPASAAPLAAALGAAAAGVNALNYVFAIRDSRAEVRTQKYYLAWRAWREKRTGS